VALMDLPYLRAHPQYLATFLTHQRIRETPVGGGSICVARRLTLDDGSSVFAKSLPEGSPVPPGFFEAEAHGLRWLRAAGAVPVPEVIAALPDLLAMEWVEPGEPDRGAAERFGRDLAALHRAGAPEFGAPWPGYIGALPLDNTPSSGPWPEWFAARRLEPYLRLSV
jgi:fructosamine-3-kinase